MPVRDDDLWDDGSGNPDLWLVQLVEGNCSFCVKTAPGASPDERRGVWIKTSTLSIP